MVNPFSSKAGLIALSSSILSGGAYNSGTGSAANILSQEETTDLTTFVDT
jgi:hypothetical protein